MRWCSMVLAVWCSAVSPTVLAAADDAPITPIITVPQGAALHLGRDLATVRQATIVAACSGVWATAKPPTAPEQTLAALHAFERYYTRPEAESYPKLLVSIATALAAGSQDGVLQYLQAKLTLREGHHRQFDAYHHAADALAHGPYPPVWYAACWMGIIQCEATGLRKIPPEDVACAVRALAAELTSLPADDRGAIDLLDLVLDRPIDNVYILNDAGEPLRAMLAGPTIPAWWSKYLQGRLELNYADRDGAGGPHAVAAEQLLAAAWHLHGDRPQAAEQGILAATEGALADGTPTDWFNRALHAQGDYMPAWDTYSLAVSRRWGGTDAQVLALGESARATGRYDTIIPYRYFEQLRALYWDGMLQHQRSPMLNRDAYLHAKEVAEHYAAVMPARAAYFQSLVASVVWMCGDGKKTQTLLAQLGDQADPTPFALLGVKLDLVRTAAPPNYAARVEADIGYHVVQPPWFGHPMGMPGESAPSIGGF